jgi:signal transduction histidine kinase
MRFSNRCTGRPVRVELEPGMQAFGTAERNLGLGFLAVVLLSVLVGVVATYAQDSVARSKDRVANIESGDLVDVERMLTHLGREVLGSQEYVLAGRETSLGGIETAQNELRARLRAVKTRGLDAEEQVLVARIERADHDRGLARDRLVELRKAGRPRNEILQALDADVSPKLEELRAALGALEQHVILRLENARQESNEAAHEAARFVRLAVIMDVLLAGGIGLLFTRTFRQLRRAHQERLALWSREREARAHAERTKQALAESVAQLEQSNRDLEAFTGRIAHDLRNLLYPLALSPARLRNARTREAFDGAAASIERSVARASSMIDGLLAFSRSAQAVDLTKSAPVGETAAAVRSDLASMAADAEAVVEMDVENLDVACSPELFYLVLMNLLHNALKFVKGRDYRRVIIRTQSAGGAVEISVEDTGPGIPPEAQARIFEPFYRVPGVKVQGTGIGLSTVQRIVVAYQGQITVESELDKGTTFRVRLPRRVPADPHEEPVSPAQEHRHS